MDTLGRAERLLELTEDWFPFAIDPTSVTTEEYALAGIARCRRLLRGMVKEHDSPDLAGSFARALYETWLTSAYLLLGEGPAYERLEANDSYQLQRMAKRFLHATDPDDPSQTKLRAQSEQLLARPTPDGQRIDTAALARAVRDLLADDPNAEWPVTMYAVLFGPESYTTAHGGIGAIKQYMLENGEVATRITSDTWRHAGHDHRLDLMTAAVLALAYKVGRAVGLRTEQLETFAQDWNMRLNGSGVSDDDGQEG